MQSSQKSKNNFEENNNVGGLTLPDSQVYYKTSQIFYTAKETINKTERQHMDQEKIFAKNATNKGKLREIMKDREA